VTHNRLPTESRRRGSGCRCWRERGARRVIVEDSYGYAPRERYIERRGYYDDGPRVGVGVGPGVGVSVGVGGGRW
jgi:hypothetical protein